mgnify:CR=1 FL=1
MTTQSQDYFVKHIESNDDHLYTVLYDSVTGAPFRIKTEMAGHYLTKSKRKSKVVDNKLVFTGEWVPAFVKTKKEIIGSPSSGDEVGEVERNDYSNYRPMGNHHKRNQV